MQVAAVTGGSQGLGLALTRQLVERGWTVVVDARRREDLESATRDLAGPGRAVPVAGDVGDPTHRAALVATVERQGRLDLLVHNASDLGPSPLPGLAHHPVDELARVFSTNVLAPVALTQLALPHLRRAAQPVVVMISSDAAVEAYAGWGGYGASKAALDQVAAVLAVEQPQLRVYAFDPGDMRTAMHQRAFPGEDISDRPEPDTVVPALLRLVDQRPPSGRYRAADLLAGQPA
jgi:NAD(P)-dependent dehydrogenase (short-subunit alcohol dehydrogenase family)